MFSANDVSGLDIYVDGADEITPHKMMIKGGGAALTREKIVAALAKTFICIVDRSKQVDVLGSTFPLPVEVIPMARSQWHVNWWRWAAHRNIVKAWLLITAILFWMFIILKFLIRLKWKKS